MAIGPSTYSNSEAEEESLFDEAISLKIEGHWVTVVNARQARDCLLNSFPDQQDASFRRALAACQACIDDRGLPAGAQSTFIVATMAAGILFQVHEIDMELMAIELASVSPEQSPDSAILPMTGPTVCEDLAEHEAQPFVRAGPHELTIVKRRPLIHFSISPCIYRLIEMSRQRLPFKVSRSYSAL